jgi:hypothetical protein
LRPFIRKPLDGSTTGVTEATISIWIPYICRIEQINVIADYTPILTPTLGQRHGGRMKTSAQLIFMAIFAATFLSNLHETSDASWRSTAIVGIPATTLGCPGDAIAVGGAIGGRVGFSVGLSSGAVVLLYWA